uniref:Uncharacterized protein n=1 Tax=Ditylenchus dipsaci TaxID=166011 RepID=A0A915CM45_9BILA
MLLVGERKQATTNTTNYMDPLTNASDSLVICSSSIGTIAQEGAEEGGGGPSCSTPMYNSTTITVRNSRIRYFGRVQPSSLLLMKALLVSVLIFINCCVVDAVKVIDNGLAPPEIVHTPISTKRAFFVVGWRRK